MPKAKKQVAAIPLRFTKSGKLRVLLVTSRETRRWVVPKGWPMEGKKQWRAAEIEAYEEAGVTGIISPIALGSFKYKKRMADGARIKCLVRVFPMHVTKRLKRWPERRERTRKWFSLKAASKLVDERELAEILAKLGKKRKAQSALLDLRKAS